MIISDDNIDLIPNISYINYSFILKNDEEQIKNIYEKYKYIHHYYKLLEVITDNDFITTINKYTNDDYKVVIIQDTHFNNSKYKIKSDKPYLNQIELK